MMLALEFDDYFLAFDDEACLLALKQSDIDYFFVYSFFSPVRCGMRYVASGRGGDYRRQEQKIFKIHRR